MDFVWGVENLQWKDADIEPARMPVASGSTLSNTMNSISTSYNNNTVRVHPNFSSSYDIPSNAVFRAGNLDTLAFLLDSMALRWKQYSYQSYPFHLILGFKAWCDVVPTLIGASMNELFVSGYHNWSYVFVGRIDTFYSSPPYIRQSVYNQTAVHELIHQLGNTFIPDNEWNSNHYYHTGPDSAACVMHYASHFYNEFLGNTSYWKICDRHINALRGLLDHPFVPRYPSAGDLRSQKECRYEIQMGLAKYEYKQYEPVVARFVVVNKDLEPMKIYNLFNPALEETYIMITDDQGNTWSVNKVFMHPSIAILAPDYIINPGDTLILSMPINNWGEKYDIHVEWRPQPKWYFSQFGFFPANRKYKAYMYFGRQNVDMYKCQLKSNEVEFRVTELNNQDSALLIDWLHNDLYNILARYPDNAFAETVYKEYLRENAFYHPDSSELMNDYHAYFDRYPNSFYLFDHGFLKHYFKRLKRENISPKEARKTIPNENVKTAIKWLLK